MVNVLTLMFKRTEEKVSFRYLVGPYDVVPKCTIFCDMALSVCL